jgi:hypothetical protein
MFSTGLQGGFALGTWPGTQGTSAQASPQASSAATAGFGTTASAAGDSGTDPVTTSVLVTGTAALVGLVLIWYSLPR